MSLMSVALFAGGLTASCGDGEQIENNLTQPTAVVTVKPTTDLSSFIIQLDDSTTLRPVNMTVSPFGTKHVRALVNYYLTENLDETKREVPVYINWMDSIPTRPTSQNLGTEQNKARYGDDPVEVIDDKFSISADGYLTLHVRTYWGDAAQHEFHLVAGENPENPYEVRLYHNAAGDANKRLGSAVIAFQLDSLPAMKDKTEKVYLRWLSFSGLLSAYTYYNSGVAGGWHRDVEQEGVDQEVH